MSGHNVCRSNSSLLDSNSPAVCSRDFQNVPQGSSLFGSSPILKQVASQRHTAVPRLESLPSSSQWSNSDAMRPFVVTPTELPPRLQGALAPGAIHALSYASIHTRDSHTQKGGPQWTLDEYSQYWNARSSSVTSPRGLSIGPPSKIDDEEVDSAVVFKQHRLSSKENSTAIQNWSKKLIELTLINPSLGTMKKSPFTKGGSTNTVPDALQPLTYNHGIYTSFGLHHSLSFSPSLAFSEFFMQPMGCATCIHLESGSQTYIFIPPSLHNLTVYISWKEGNCRVPVFESLYQLNLVPSDTVYVPPGWIAASITREASVMCASSWIDSRHLALHLDAYRIQKHLDEGSYFPSIESNLKHPTWIYAQNLAAVLTKASGLTAQQILEKGTCGMPSPDDAMESLEQRTVEKPCRKQRSSKVKKRRRKNSDDSFIASEDDNDVWLETDGESLQNSLFSDEDVEEEGVRNSQEARRLGRSSRRSTYAQSASPMEDEDPHGMRCEKTGTVIKKPSMLRIKMKMPETTVKGNLRVILKTKVPQVDGADDEDDRFFIAGDPWAEANAVALVSVLESWLENAPPCLGTSGGSLLTMLRVLVDHFHFKERPDPLNMIVLLEEKGDDYVPADERVGTGHRNTHSYTKEQKNATKNTLYSVGGRKETRGVKKKPPVKKRLMKKLGMK